MHAGFLGLAHESKCKEYGDDGQKRRHEHESGPKNPVGACNFLCESFRLIGDRIFNLVREGAMRESWELRQYLGEQGSLAPELVAKAPPSHLLMHPTLQKGFCRLPQIEFRIELPPEPFNVQKRLLQQYKLRLDLDIESSRSLEQSQQHLPKRDL